MCPFTVTTDPGSAVPATMTFCASRVAPATGAAMVIVGGVRSSTTVYDDAETTSRSPISVMLIEFAPSFSASVALKEPLGSRGVVVTTAPLSAICRLRSAWTANDGTLPVSCSCGSRVYAGTESATGAAPRLEPPAGSSIDPRPCRNGTASCTCATISSNAAPTEDAARGSVARARIASATASAASIHRGRAGPRTPAPRAIAR